MIFSDIIWRLLETDSGEAQSAANPDLIATIHDLFAVGALASPAKPNIHVPNNVPDGASIFLFAEFGHVAIEQKVRPEGWRALIPTLTRMPALYLELHRLHDPLSLPRSFDDFGPPPDYRAHQGRLQEYVEQARQVYEKMEVSELEWELGRLARNAFGDGS